MLEALSCAAFDDDVARLDSRAALRKSWTVIEARYPVLDVVFRHRDATPLRVRLMCDDWDEQPPSIDLMSEDGAFLAKPPHNVGGVFHDGPHPATSRPFVCMRGSREYHTHPSHLSEPWDQYRGTQGNDLIGLVDQIFRVWRRGL